jgi:hypothetical protein
VPGKNDIIEEAIHRRANWRDSLTTLYEGKEHKFSVECHEPFVVEIQNATIFGPHAMVRTPDRNLPLEVKANIRGTTGSFDSMLRSTLRWFGRANSLKTIVNPGHPDNRFEVAASILTGRKSTTPAYGHWLVEILPRIRGIKYYQKQTGRKPAILVSPNITDWQIKTLEMTGIDTNKLVEWEGGQAVIDRYVLPMWAKSEWCASNINWISNQIESSVNYEMYLDQFSSRVYLSRENMNRREIMNRDQIISEISEYGFKSYTPESMTFAEQVALFKSADFIIGPTGGSFANIIFSTDVKIIELFQPEHFITWPFELSQVLDFEYHTLFGDGIRDDPVPNAHHQDFHLSPHKIKELLEMII